MTSLVNRWESWCERRSILRDIRREQRQTRRWAAFKVRDNLIAALTALQGDDHRRATELWTATLAQYPTEARKSSRALDVLIGLRRLDEAEAMMQMVSARGARTVEHVMGLARIAVARGDHNTAVERWAALRKKHPNIMDGYASGVEALLELNRIDEAESLAKQALCRFRDQVRVFMVYARIAERRLDWEEARSRWDNVRNRFNHATGYTGAAGAMVRLGQYDAAENLLKAGRVRYPTEATFAIGLARCSQYRGDTKEAVVRWNQVAQRFPLHANACLAAAEALEGLGQFSDAETILREVANRRPTESRPFVALANFYHRTSAFSPEADVWLGLHKVFPQSKEYYIRCIESLNLCGRQDEIRALNAEQHGRVS